MKFQNQFKDKKVLITGISGFKGTWLTCWLHLLGAKIFGVSLKDLPNPSMFRLVNGSKIATHDTIDIKDYSLVKKAIDEIEPDFIFHIAAQALTREAFLNPLNTFNTNIMGTVNILEALRNHSKPCSVVLVTSDKCYENKEWIWGYRENDEIGGKDPYSASKGACEIVISSYFRTYFSKENSPVRIASVRAGNIIGGGDWAKDRIIPDAVKSWLSGNPVSIRSGNSTRPWQHVLEPLNGYLSLAGALSEGLYNGEAFNFGPKEESCVSVSSLISIFAEQWDGNLPNPCVKIEQSESFPESKLLKLNCEKAFTYLNWKPKLDIQETLKITANWYLTNHKKEDMLAFTFQQINEFNKI